MPTDPHTPPLPGEYASELLEVAEAILFSVPQLPPTVLDKYRLIQAEIKARAATIPTRTPDASRSTGILTAEDRALMHEKLAAAKRRNATLEARLSEMELQLAQATNKIAALHAHHKASLIEVQEQTRQVMEESHARALAEMETRARHDGSRARQLLEDQLAAERAFHTNATEKIQALTAMFPEAYASTVTEAVSPSSSTPHAQALARALTAGDVLASSTSALHPNSAPRLQLAAFFEATRRALNTSRHTTDELRAVREELHAARRIVQLGEERQYAAHKSLADVQRRAKDLAAELTSGALIQERDAILARVQELDAKRRAAIAAVTTALSTPAESDAARTSELSSKDVSPTAAGTRARTSKRPSPRTTAPRPSVGGHSSPAAAAAATADVVPVPSLHISRVDPSIVKPAPTERDAGYDDVAPETEPAEGDAQTPRTLDRSRFDADDSQGADDHDTELYNADETYAEEEDF